MKQGGYVAAIDCSDSTLVLEPQPDDFPAIMAARQRWFSERGSDPNIGHRLPRLLRAAGLRNVEVRTVVVSSAVIGLDAFAQVVLRSFVDAAEKQSPGDARIKSGAQAAAEWRLNKEAFGAIMLFVVGGEKAP